MNKIKTFNLKIGTRIGNYKIIKPLGRGWEGEVYQVEEVPTEAKRAMKILRKVVKKTVRNYTHTAWFFEQLSNTGAVARYYHMGQWFLDDDEGIYYLVFEKLNGPLLIDYIKKNKNKRSFDAPLRLKLFINIVDKVVKIHRLGLAVGDFSLGNNIILVNNTNPVFCDLEPGKADKPNVQFVEDLIELENTLDLIFTSLKDSSTYLYVKKLLANYNKQKNSKNLLLSFYKQLLRIKE